MSNWEKTLPVQSQDQMEWLLLHMGLEVHQVKGGLEVFDKQKTMDGNKNPYSILSYATL